MTRKTLVLAEARDCELRHISFEAIAAGRQLAEGGEIVAVICGNGIKNLGETLIHYGADRVLTVEHEDLTNDTAEAYKQALGQVIKAESPEAIVFGHTSLGKDLAPSLAARLESGLISDVTEIAINGGDVEFTRPIYAGKAFEKKKVTSSLLFVTLRPNNVEAMEKDESRNGEVSSFDVDIRDLRTRMKDIIRRSTRDGVDLSEAKIVVSGGRGVKSKEGFKPLYELAEVLGGAVGASRGAADAGYCDYALQIGQTGKVVTPDLYIACGISGAIQHLAGMSNAKCIVAINKDAEANIFNVADYGIVGDLSDIIPKLTEELKAILYENL